MADAAPTGPHSRHLTYDPLLSRNAYLNIAKLGATCNTYLGSYYGEMSDGLNIGLSTDRFQVDWWLISRRVERRLGKHPRGALSLNHLIQAGCQPLYAPQPDKDDLLPPPEKIPPFSEKVLAVEIPPDFMALKAADMELAKAWRFFTRDFFKAVFSSGYIITDFIFEHGRSFYVLSHGQATLEGDL
jgi:predicted GNAT superfamily acetyltransferase